MQISSDNFLQLIVSFSICLARLNNYKLSDLNAFPNQNCHIIHAKKMSERRGNFCQKSITKNVYFKTLENKLSTTLLMVFKDISGISHFVKSFFE